MRPGGLSQHPLRLLGLGVSSLREPSWRQLPLLLLSTPKISNSAISVIALRRKMRHNSGPF